MKPLFISIAALLLLGVFNCGAQNSFFRMHEFSSNELYQNYVGKKVVFYEPVNKDEQKIRLKGVKNGRPYTIQSIKYRESNPIAEAKIFIDITDDEYVNSPTITIKCDPNVVDNIPMYFVDVFEDWKKAYIGTEVAYPGEPYVVTDLVWEKKKILDNYYVYVPYVVYQGKETQIEFKKVLDKELDSESVIELSQVEKPADETIRYGETSVIQGDRVAKYGYVDNVLFLLIYGTKSGFFIELENVSENSIRVIWDEAVFVNVKGVTYKVTHNGVKPDGRDVEQTPSLIIKGAKLVDTIIPSDLEYEDYDRTWIVKNMFPEKFGEVGKVSLMLPIQIKDTVNEYIFVFDVTTRWIHPELHASDAVVDLHFDYRSPKNK